jgi:hypothetical protein
MKTVIGVLFLFASTVGYPQTDAVATGRDHAEFDFRPGGSLKLDLCSGEVRIEGTDQDKVRVRYDNDNSHSLSGVKVLFYSSGNSGELHVSGGPKNHFELVVQVPRFTNLRIRVPAGEVEVSGITGDKDVELHAGELTIAPVRSEDYYHLDASVTTGELDAGDFSVFKGGLFRSFSTGGPGKYRLHAHVGAGQLTLD